MSDPTTLQFDPSNWQPPTPEELQALLPGYRIECFLARGGMGAVYRGVQLSLERLVAIKILPPQMLAADPTFAGRFKQEAKAMAQFNHPGIVSVYDFGEMKDGTLYFVMEYVDGTDVARMIQRQGRLRSAHAMAITAHVCDALQYAHERGVVHRDIKPANIMVSHDGRVKVADFGLAKTLQNMNSGLTMSGHVMGTPHFVAPEALTLGMQLDHRADIYAVGVMLYQMLTGNLPQGLFEMPSLKVPGLDPRYDQIVTNAMREDRAVRYQSILDMRRALDAILTQPMQAQTAAAKPAAQRTVVGGPTHQKQRAPGQPLRPPQRQAMASAPRKKSSAAAWLALVVVLGAVAGGAFWLFRTPASVAGKNANASDDPSSALKAATKEQPFVNTLGMKFVPVPGTKVLMCIHETRRQDYEAYAGQDPQVNSTWRSMKHEGVPSGQNNEHPVVGVNLEDVRGFCAWLSKKEERVYRLPDEREWDLAAGLKTNYPAIEGRYPGDTDFETKFPWGGVWPPPAPVGNYGDAAYLRAFPDSKNKLLTSYNDGYATTSPVMSFSPNSHGFFDLGGNVWEFCEGWCDEKSGWRLLKGGSFDWAEERVAACAERYPTYSGTRSSHYGFRCVLELPAPNMASDGASPQQPAASVTEGDTHENSLGMKPDAANPPIITLRLASAPEKFLSAQPGEDLRAGAQPATRFRLVPGIADSKLVSLEMAGSPGYFVRHSWAVARVQKSAGKEDTVFDLDATWRMIQLGDGKARFESHNYPGTFLVVREDGSVAQLADAPLAQSVFLLE